MDNTVTQEVFKRIDALAEKMGTTAQYLWPKLVQYEFNRGFMDIVSSMALTALFFYFTLRAYQYGNTAEGKERYRSSDPKPYNVLALLLGIVACLLLIATLLFAPNNLVAIFSPEAAAFYKLVGK
jgi:hypothetical protein